MSARANLQDTFLNAARRQKVPVTIFLVNGVKLGGAITWYDNFCVLLRRDRSVQLVYKHAISTIMPLAAIRLQESTTTDAPPAAGGDAGDAVADRPAEPAEVKGG